jgi:hypothetical protein
VANEVGSGGRPAPLGDVRMALEALPREAWGLPGMGPPALPSPAPAGGAAPHPAAAPVADGAGAAQADRAAAPVADGTALVPVPASTDASRALDRPGARQPGRLARLDAFASESPPMRLALRQLGRAVAAKAVRLVVWPRRAGR